MRHMVTTRGPGRFELPVAGPDLVCCFPMDRAKGRVLVVDDNATFARVLCEALTLRGYDVRAETSVVAAKGALSGARFDAVICDYDLGGRTGIAVLENTPRSSLRVLTTAVESVEPTEFFQRGQLDVFLKKPVELDELCELIKAHSEARSAMGH